MQSNPFDMSSMGLNQDNPLFTSMNMMRQMWENMASNPMDMSASAAAMPSAEDLEKRIKDLQAVENWLRLNLSMLTSTIQGLEIQRSTLSTLNSFAQSSMATMQSMSQPPAAADTEKPATSTDEENPAEGLMQAGQAWWGMMQQQFDAIAQATTQSLQQAQTASATVAPDIPNPSADSTFGKKAAAKSEAESKKPAAKKAAAKKTTAKTTAAKKNPPSAKS